MTKQVIVDKDQEILEAEWLRLCQKYGHGSDYRIVCDPNYVCKESLPWDSASKIRGEVKQAEKQICLYDKSLNDKLECLRHEYFEMLFDLLVNPFVTLCNSFEYSINKMIKEQNELSNAFMKDSYLNKEIFIGKFVDLEAQAYYLTQKLGQVKKR